MAFPSFPPFLLLSSGIVEKGLLQEAAPLLLRPFSPPKRNIISPAEHEERGESGGGTFYPSLNGAMNHEVKKGLGRHAEDRKEGRWAFDREEGQGRGGVETIFPQRSQLSRRRGQNGNGEIVFTRRPRQIHGIPVTFGYERPTPTRRQGRRERGDRQTRLTEQTILGGEIPMVRRRELS